MPMIYQIGAGGYWTGASREIGERDGAPRGWTRTAVPTLGAGEYAVWGNGGWAVTDQAYVAPAPDAPVPAAVSRFQARAALLAAGLLATIENAVAAYDGEDASLVQLAWSEATEWKRLSPTVTALASIVGLTDQQLDDLFIAAAQIEA